MDMIEVRQLQNWETHEWLLHVHYAKRLPSISFAFGLFVDNAMKGLVTYGTPVASTLRDGVAGKQCADIVLELNRLVFIKSVKNHPSMLVGRSLRMLPKPSIVVSFADTDQRHIGYVYQACNFIYTGLSAKRTDWKVKGMEHLHGATIADQSRGKPNRAEWMREKHGDNFYLQDRPRKHRYIYIVAKGQQRKAIQSALLYSAQPYPKGDSERYAIDYQPSYQTGLFEEAA
jgi:hypothetical protein